MNFLKINFPFVCSYRRICYFQSRSQTICIIEQKNMSCHFNYSESKGAFSFHDFLNGIIEFSSVDQRRRLFLMNVFAEMTYVPHQGQAFPAVFYSCGFCGTSLSISDWGSVSKLKFRHLPSIYLANIQLLQEANKSGSQNDAIFLVM